MTTLPHRHPITQFAIDAAAVVSAIVFVCTGALAILAVGFTLFF